MKARATCNSGARYLWQQSLCIRPKGFTLVELLVVIAIIAIIAILARMNRRQTGYGTNPKTVIEQNPGQTFGHLDAWRFSWRDLSQSNGSCAFFRRLATFDSRDVAKLRLLTDFQC
jgi:prepilin-type N-terminal cleavage/methylation domain-containing protein